MFRNNVFTNPIGWARVLVGNRRRYLLVSASTVVLGLALVLLFHLSETGVWVAAGAGVLVFTGCLE